MGPTSEASTGELLVLSEGCELSLSGLDILQVDSGTTATGASEPFSMG